MTDPTCHGDHGEHGSLVRPCTRLPYPTHSHVFEANLYYQMNLQLEFSLFTGTHEAAARPGPPTNTGNQVVLPTIMASAPPTLSSGWDQVRVTVYVRLEDPQAARAGTSPSQP